MTAVDHSCDLIHFFCSEQHFLSLNVLLLISKEMLEQFVIKSVWMCFLSGLYFMLSFPAVDSQGYSLSPRLNSTQLIDSSCFDTARLDSLCFSWEKISMKEDMKSISEEETLFLGWATCYLTKGKKNTNQLGFFFFSSEMFIIHLTL